MNVNYPIIDADGHVMEKDTELREFLEGRYREGPHFQTYSFFPSGVPTTPFGHESESHPIASVITLTNWLLPGAR